MSHAVAVLSVLDALTCRPSRASAAAIGQRFVLNRASPALAVRGLDALGDMLCEWTVAILDQAIHDSSRLPMVRQHALAKLCVLLNAALQRGYTKLDRQGFFRLMGEAQRSVEDGKRNVDAETIPAVEELCNHLSEAVSDGVFGQLPDY